MIDHFTLADIKQGKERQQAYSHYYWGVYTELAFQRSLRADEIKKSLVDAAVGPFPFSGYQRVVRYKWALEPLSMMGSVKDIGGRFNIGDINRTDIPSFQALYLGEDKDTSIQEFFQNDLFPKSGLTPQELSLSSPDSVLFISVYGSLESIIDLNQPQRLQRFVDLIKGFEESDSLKKEGEKLGKVENLVRNIEGFLSAIYDPNWRVLPMQVDIPASSQIFGKLVSEAGIERVRYKSKYTEKSCLAIFPQNFVGPDSFVQIMDESPNAVKQKRLDHLSSNRLKER